VDAAEALGAAGDPRLKLPWEEGYWVEIGGGPYVLGAQREDPGGERYDAEAFKDERVLRGTVPDFALGRYPVTVWEYCQYLQDLDGETETKATPNKWEDQMEHPSRPVVCVDWAQAVEYCRWATAKYGRSVRLPEEHEWEYAARGSSARRFSWGPEDPDPWRANYHETGVKAASPVGIFPAGNTPDGLADMAGNVLEWTASDNEGAKTIRGGSFVNDGRRLRAAVRDRFHPVDRFFYLGFRCLRE